MGMNMTISCNTCDFEEEDMPVGIGMRGFALSVGCCDSCKTLQTTSRNTAPGAPWEESLCYECKEPLRSISTDSIHTSDCPACPGSLRAMASGGFWD